MRLKHFKHTSLVFILLLAACAPVNTGASNLSPTVPPTVQAPTVVPSTTPLPIPPTATPTPGPITVDQTPAQRAAIQAMSQKYNIPVDQIQLANTEAVTWPNGCLGVVLPGVMCTNAQVPGFRIMLTANGKQYEFHTNQDGTVALSAAQLQATLRFAVEAADQTIQLVDPSIPLGPTYNPAFNGFLPAGGANNGAAYVLDFTSPSKAVMLDGSGPHDLSFINNPSYGLALWRGGPNTKARLAWGTSPTGTDQTSSLQISDIDGANLKTLLTVDATVNPRVQIVAEAWSADGQTLYFSKEPWGIGGYILFTGASSLYQIDITSKQVKELIPFNLTNGSSICLDAITADFQFVTDHCDQKDITVRDLVKGTTSVIQPPAEVSSFGALGSARFSPDGKRVAFALGKRDPSAEQVWVAVSDSTSGASKLVITGQPGVTYNVLGWLDDQTLLLQTNSIQCSTNCGSELWTVSIDGSNLKKVADGSLLAIVDNQ